MRKHMVAVLACLAVVVWYGPAVGDDAPEKGAPKQGAPKQGAPNKGAPNKGAPNKGEKRGQLFDRLDADSSGQLTKEEVPEENRRRFDRLLRTSDKDGDGKISRAEFLEGNRSQRPKRSLERLQPSQRGGRMPAGSQAGNRLMRAVDTDRDGELSADEIVAASAALRKLDKNGDGRLSRQELTSGGPPSRARRTDAATRQGSASRRQFDPQQMVARVMGHDKDGDGKVSRAEASERLAKRFDRVDANSDGQLSKEEVEQHAAQVAERVKQGRSGEGRTKGGKSRRGPDQKRNRPQNDSV